VPDQAAHCSSILANQCLTGDCLQFCKVQVAEQFFNFGDLLRPHAQAADPKPCEDCRCERIRGCIAANGDVPAPPSGTVNHSLHQTQNRRVDIVILGAPAAWSFGPLMQFVSGTRYAGRALIHCIAGRMPAPDECEGLSWRQA